MMYTFHIIKYYVFIDKLIQFKAFLSPFYIIDHDSPQQNYAL